MKYEQYHYRKSILGFIEVSFFRLFPSLSIIGAMELGGETFLAVNAYWFFLALPVIDTLRCILYWNKEDGADSPFKKNWNRTYYTLRMVFNLLASAFIVAANRFGIENMLMPGEILFIAGVVGLPALEYIIKAFGGLNENLNEHDRDKKEESRSIKNGLLAMTLLTVMAGLTLLYFHPEITVSQQPLGWFLLIIGNAIPVVGFGAYKGDKWLIGSSVLLLAGIGLLFAAPEMSLGIDHYVRDNLFQAEVGVALGMVLGGFALSLGRMAFKLFAEKKNDSIIPKKTTTTLAKQNSNEATLAPTSSVGCSNIVSALYNYLTSDKNRRSQLKRQLINQ